MISVRAMARTKASVRIILASNRETIVRGGTCASLHTACRPIGASVHAERWCRFAKHCATISPDIPGEGLPASTPPSNLGALLAADGGKRFVFVGGKGGVGKTTTAAAIALGFARSGRKTLVVSTDPAHSLGDALAMPLTGKPQQVDLVGLDTNGGSLHGMEIDPVEVLDSFKRALNIEQLRKSLADGQGGLGTGILETVAKAGVDLEAFAQMVENVPPGVDEAVALARLIQLLQDDKHAAFERVVIDTAPTGHTLRLLSFPRFLHTMIETLLSVQEKVAAYNPVGQVGQIFGMGKSFGQLIGDDLQRQLAVTKASIEQLMDSTASLSAVFADSDSTTFVVVAIPTHLAVAESRRLLIALDEAKMSARHVIVNQVPYLGAEGRRATQDARAAAEKLAMSREAAGVTEAEAQALCRVMERLGRQCEDAQRQIDILDREIGPRAHLLQIPVFDQELTGVTALDGYTSILLDS